MAKTRTSPQSLLFFFIFCFISIQFIESIDQPHTLESLKIQEDNNQIARSSSCAYTVSIKTSCSSIQYTHDMISLSFGDAYGHQVYVPRLDDPYSRAFERCSTDTYQISGPCMNSVCYVYLSRTGSDGWKPELVTISGYYTKARTFYYNAFLPYRTWFGFDYCNGVVSSM